MVHSADFSVISSHLYKMGIDEILRRYVPDFEHASTWRRSGRTLCRESDWVEDFAHSVMVVEIA